jgi:hypothetical protein
MTPEAREHLEAFSGKLTEVGSRIGSFLHECVDAGVDVNSPETGKSLSLTAYELMFVIEAIEQCLQAKRLRVLREEEE